LVGCQASGEAMIVDPGRDIAPYLRVAEQEGLRIVAITETHIHADFVSGTLELADRTGATAYLSDEGDADWKYQFADGIHAVLLKDGDGWQVGNLRVEAMHTPGHTPEHMSYLLTDGAAADRPMGIFTGDFVFVGDVGRPDLLEVAAGFADTAAPGARTLFRSLQRFAQLPDYLQVWPAHGAGSACGKALGAVPSTTVGYEKLFNWALKIQDQETFVQQVLAGQPESPRYFATMKRLNKVGPPLLKGLPLPPRLTGHHLATLAAGNATILDTRDASAFAEAHVPGTWNVPLHGAFTTHAGWLLEYDEPYYLIVDVADLESVLRALFSIGLDGVAGYFCPEAVEFWGRETGQELQGMAQVSPQQIKDAVNSGQVQVIDVRGATEFAEGHLPGAINIPLGYVLDRARELPAREPLLINCSTGLRSAIAASLLQSSGFAQVVNLRGGYESWRAENLPVVQENGAYQPA
jgi:hydroxyacylglutathione hydrolase